MKLTSGQITGILTAIGTVAAAFGAPEVAAVTGNPFVGTVLTALIGGIGSLFAGHLQGGKSAAPVAKAA